MKTSFGVCLLLVRALGLEPTHYPALHACLLLGASFHNAVASLPTQFRWTPFGLVSQRLSEGGSSISKSVFASVHYGAVTPTPPLSTIYSRLIDLQPNTVCISV